jgi:hypothetical protein
VLIHLFLFESQRYEHYPNPKNGQPRKSDHDPSRDHADDLKETMDPSLELTVAILTGHVLLCVPGAF